MEKFVIILILFACAFVCTLLLLIIHSVIQNMKRKREKARIEDFLAQKTKNTDSKSFVCFDDRGHMNRALSIDYSNRLIMTVEYNEKENVMHFKRYKFSDLLSCSITQNKETVTKTSLDNAILGGMLLGRTAALVGGITGKKTTSNHVTEMSMAVTFHDLKNPYYTFPFVLRSKAVVNVRDILQWHSILNLVITEQTNQ